MSSSNRRSSYRDVIIIGILIGGVCFVTLTPAIYLLFHALHWAWALRLVEAIFLPALFLAVAAGLFVYQRARAQQALWQQDDSPQKRS